MASYKIFPESDATIYSDTPDLNTGLDEILELRNIAGTQGYNEVSRILLKFSSEEINDLFTNKVNGSNFNVYLKMYNTETSEIPLNYTINAYAVSQSWNMGVGKFLYSPYITKDVTWSDRKNGTVWYNPLDHLDSYTDVFYRNDVGGGAWYKTLRASQSFGYTDEKDLKLDVSDIAESLYSGSVPNDGIIVKFTSSLEFTTGSNTIVKFFSRDTHTIYPPHLEFVWDDYSYNPGDLSTITSQNILMSVSNLKESYDTNEVVKMRLFCRDQFPTRTFSTNGLYSTNKILPAETYWAIKDVKTDEFIIDFESYNRVSCDPNGNFFTLYMNGLQPERYYKILVKTTTSGVTTMLENKTHFKVRS